MNSAQVRVVILPFYYNIVYYIYRQFKQYCGSCYAGTMVRIQHKEVAFCKDEGDVGALRANFCGGFC